MAPEQGRSALDALLLAFNGVEFLREHVRDDVRMHYTITETPGPAHVVPARAVGEFSMRSYSREALDQAAACNAPGIGPVRRKTGSTDFGNVTNHMPGSCIRVKFVPGGTSSHSQAFVDAGKTKEGHEAILYGAKILAGTSLELIRKPELIDELWKDFEEAKKREQSKTAFPALKSYGCERFPSFHLGSSKKPSP